MQSAALSVPGSVVGSETAIRNRAAVGLRVIRQRGSAQKAALSMAGRWVCCGGARLISIEMGMYRMRTGMETIFRSKGKAGYIRSHASGSSTLLYNRYVFMLIYTLYYYIVLFFLEVTFYSCAFVLNSFFINYLFSYDSDCDFLLLVR